MYYVLSAGEHKPLAIRLMLIVFGKTTTASTAAVPNWSRCCSTFALGQRTITTFVRRCSKHTDALQHFVNFRFQNSEIFDGLELVQMFLKPLFDVQFFCVFIVFQERPVFFDSVELTCGEAKDKEKPDFNKITKEIDDLIKRGRVPKSFEGITRRAAP